MKVLVINSGSSSLKYQLIDMETEAVIAKGNCERIGIDGSKLTHKANGKELTVEKAMPDHNVAVELVDITVGYFVFVRAERPALRRIEHLKKADQ